MLYKVLQLLPTNLREIIFKLLSKGSNRKLASHALWSLSGALLSKSLVLVSAMVVARILGKEVYGQLGIVRSSIMMFVSFTSFGLGATASRFIAEFKRNNPEKALDTYIVTTIFACFIGAAATLLIIFFAPVVASNLLGAPELKSELVIGAITFFFIMLIGAQTGALAGFEDFKRIAFSNVLKAVTQSLFLLGGATYFGLKGAVIGFGLSFFITWVYDFFTLRKHILSLGIKLSSRLKELTLQKFSVLWKFSLPAAVSSMIMPPAVWWAKTYLIRKEGFESLAVFDVAEQWQAQILFVPSVLAQIVLPLLASSSSNKENFLHTIKSNLLINLAAAIVLTIIVYFLSGYILSGYGKGFDNTLPLLLLSLSAVIISVTNIVNPIIMTYNKMWMGVAINLVWAFVFILLSTFLIENGYAENGLAVAIFLSYCVSLFLFSIYTMRLLKVNE